MFIKTGYAPLVDSGKYLRRGILLTVLITMALAPLILRAAESNVTVKEIFEKTALKVVSVSSIAVYVPVSIQSLDVYAKDGCTLSKGDRSSYDIALYGRVTEYGKTEPLPCGEGGDAALLAEIHGDGKPMPNMPMNRLARRVTLKSGASGWFNPVSCGGSCSPATLFWQTPHASYWIQMKFGSSVPRNEQLRELMNIANSVVVVPRR